MSNEPTKDVIGEITSLSECELFIFSNFNLEDPTKKEQCSLFKEVKLYEGDPPPELEFDIKRTTERAVQHIDEIAKLINEQKNNKSNFEEDNPELKT